MTQAFAIEASNKVAGDEDIEMNSFYFLVTLNMIGKDFERSFFWSCSINRFLTPE